MAACQSAIIRLMLYMYTVADLGSAIQPKLLLHMYTVTDLGPVLPGTEAVEQASLLSWDRRGRVYV